MMFRIISRVASVALLCSIFPSAFALPSSSGLEPPYVEEARALTPATLEKVKAASDADDLDAKMVLGFAYLEGDAGLPIDYRRAAESFEGAAAGGQVFGQLMMAAIYLEGKHAEGGAAKALPWLIKAAEQGEPEAFNLLGWIYLYGKPGVNADPMEACKWLAIGKISTRDEGKVRAFEKSLALAEKSLTPDRIEICNGIARNWNTGHAKK